ncbi:N-formylglutamate amidohydrolase [Pseudomonas asiatica]|uniref:N-formylglutamate amidohydrolase n=1 Tax=Pseudomonas asiatica TaxID=2219225 RepID=UPI00383A20B4
MITPDVSTAAFDLYLPRVPSIPLVFDSPHSWGGWPESVETSAPKEAILTAWDAYIDELWADVVEVGATLLAARFHRSYIDANRSETDIDLELLNGPWPGEVKPSEKVDKGMGLIRRFALPGVPMYKSQLPVSEVQYRLDTYYRPYHRALASALENAKGDSPRLIHVDLHSMKSVGNRMNSDAGQKRPDIVVSDRNGTTSDHKLTQWIAAKLTELGYSVSVNSPYLGAELVRRYGCPQSGVHSVQIELNRSLYMNEISFEKNQGFDKLKSKLGAFQRELAVYIQQSSTSFLNAA